MSPFLYCEGCGQEVWCAHGKQGVMKVHSCPKPPYEFHRTPEYVALESRLSEVLRDHAIADVMSEIESTVNKLMNKGLPVPGEGSQGDQKEQPR